MTETAPARDAPIECPDLATLACAPLAPRVYAHVELCDVCQLAIEFLAIAAPDDASCAAFEPLLAARADGVLSGAAADLLEGHLARCAACRAVADALAPIDPDGGNDTLPRVDPSAYALGMEVARGGMGRILAARDLRVGRPVAVKELLGRSRQLAARFEREARVTARLQHPGIVPIYEIGRWPDGTPFYSMRMVDGRTLREAIADAPTLAARLALLPAVIAATEAVAFAHAQRIIHRDLTPSNVLVGAYGETVVIDWGLAKDLADTTAEDTYAGPFRERGAELTGAGAVIGTAAYMPPEQARAEHVDERGDVYALGAILYHVLAGAAPYRGEDTLARVKAAPPPPVDELVPGAPRDLVSIVDKAMARDPAARYPSALELADELERFQTGRMVQAHEYTTFERTRRFVARNRAALAVTLVGVLVLGATGGVAITRVYRERAAATQTVTALLEEQGRAELLAGNALRAAAFLVEAQRRGDDSRALGFMLASARREITSIRATLDCATPSTPADVREMWLSPDGALLAAACVDTVKVWRIDDERRDPVQLWAAEIHDGFDVIRFSHDGTRVYTGGLDGVARAFDARTGKRLGEFPHAKDRGHITWLGTTPDDALLLTTGRDGTAQAWDVATGRRIYAPLLAGEPLLVGVHGRLTPDGKTLLTATLGGTATGWEVATGAKINSVEHGAQVLGGEISPDGKLACSPGMDRRVKVWDLAAQRAIHTLVGYGDAVWKCVFSPDGTLLATGSQDGTAKVWDVETGALVASAQTGDIVWSLAWSPDSQIVATSSLLGGSLKVWQAKTGALLASYDDPFGGKASLFSHDGKRLIAQRGDGRIRIYDHPGGSLERTFTPAKLLGASTDGTIAAIPSTRPGFGFGGIALVRTDTGKPIAHEPIDVPFAFGGRHVAARSEDGVAIIVLGTGRTVHLPIAAPRALALSPDGKRVAALERDAVALWDVDDARVIVRVPLLGKAPKLGGLSRDGSRIAVHQQLADGAQELVLWTSSGRIVRTEPVANDFATFDPDGLRIAAVGPDNIVRVIVGATGEVESQFSGEQLSRAQVNADGTLAAAIDLLGTSALVIATADGRVLSRWPLSHDDIRVTETSFSLPDAAAWWADDERIVTRARSLVVWGAPSSSQIDERKYLANQPWRIRDGRVELVTGTMRACVKRGGTALAATQLTIALREVPRRPDSMEWRTTMARLRSRAVKTGDDGCFVVGEVLPGDYSLVAERGETRIVHVALDAEDDVVDLAQAGPAEVALVPDR